MNEQEKMSKDEYLEFIKEIDDRKKKPKPSIKIDSKNSSIYEKLVASICNSFTRNLSLNLYKIIDERIKMKFDLSDIEVNPDFAIIYNDNNTSAIQQEQVPALVVELIPENPQIYNLNEKRIYYLRIPKLKYVILVSMVRKFISVYECMEDAERWLYTEYENPETEINLEKLNILLKVHDFYGNIQFTNDTLIN